MNNIEILEKLKIIFKRVIDPNKDFTNIDENTNIIKDLGVNSVGLIYLLMAIEEYFDIADKITAKLDLQEEQKAAE